jgi:hypothetical protein
VNDDDGGVTVDVADGLTRAGGALQKHSGRQGSIFSGLSNGTGAARNEQGLSVLDEILGDTGGRTEVLDRVTNIWDSTGRGVRYRNDGSFIGLLGPSPVIAGYHLVLASSVGDRDGMALELTRDDGERVAEVFEDDESGTRTFTVYGEQQVPPGRNRVAHHSRPRRCSGVFGLVMIC